MEGTPSRSPATPDQLPPVRLLAFFLVPGALMTIAFVMLAPVAETLALPPITAPLAAIVGVLAIAAANAYDQSLRQGDEKCHCSWIATTCPQ
jgi:hypothetical protein